MFISVALCTAIVLSNVIIASAGPIQVSAFLKANGKVLRNNYGSGDIVYLRGTNAGNYLIQEFWMSLTEGSSQVKAEIDIYNKLTERFGNDKMRELINYYQDQYWTTKDFDNIASIGMNCIRLPIFYLTLEDNNGNDIQKGWNRIDWFVNEASKRGIYVVLDMHGAPGSQNGSDHSGVDGGDNKKGASQFFWGNDAQKNQERYYKLWEKIARRYKDNPAVAGYDLLNEPFCTYRYNSGESDDSLHNLLWEIYDNAYKRIRAIDSNHVIIMEATWEPSDLPNPDWYGWSNVMYEYHNYLYDDYDNKAGQQIANMQNKINNIKNKNYNVPSYMGEFSYFNNLSAWSEGVKLLNDNGLSWTTWSYKTVDYYGNWGLYHHGSENKVNIERDSFDDIKRKWVNVQTSSANSDLINTIKPFLSGTEQSAVNNGQTEGVNSGFSDGEYFIIAEANGKVVCADNYGESPLAAVRNNYGGAWETFNIVNNNDGTISFRAGSNNKYVCAVLDEDKQLLARSERIEDWEKFKIVKVTNDQYAIQSTANGKYVRADVASGINILKADSSKIQAWECFYFYRV